MKFTIQPDIFAKFPDYKVGVIIATGIHQQDSDKITQLIKNAESHTKDVANDNPHFQEWSDAFDQLGFADEVKPAHVALLERAQKESLPNIFPLVDYLNAISLIEELPIGAHDFGNLTEGIEVRPTIEADEFLPRNKKKTEIVEPGVFAYTSDNTVLTKHWIWRQGQTSAVNENTQNVFIPIDTLGSISESELLEKMERICTDLQELFGAQTQTFLVDKTTPECEWFLLESLSESDRQLYETLTRGVAQVLPSRDSLAQLMKKRKIKLYLGIDPTGSLLTLGHSVVLRKLQKFAELGHDVYLLIGNGTVRIGDPTGRDSTRPVLTDEQIQENFKEWKAQASKILDFNKIKIVYNGDWLDKLSYADMVKLMAQTTVQQLIERDMFQDRIQKGLPIFGHEIMYPLLQGYDSVALNVDLELGGTDQTFNMMMGRHLQKVYNNHEKWVLSTPIINGTDGRKMSKSFNNFVALTEEPQSMYGKLMSIPDEMIAEYFLLLTDEPWESVENMIEAMNKGDNPMQYKKKLAFKITQMYHSQAEALQAAVHFEKTVQKKEVPDDIPTIELRDQSLSVLEILQFALPKESKSQLRRFIEQSAVEITYKTREKGKPTDPYQLIATVNIDVIRVGKRKYFKVITK